MAVVEFADVVEIIDDDLDPIEFDYNHEPTAHIYNDYDYPIALCGHVAPYDIDDNPKLPWIEGIYDCKECWSIMHTLEDIDIL